MKRPYIADVVWYLILPVKDKTRSGPSKGTHAKLCPRELAGVDDGLDMPLDGKARAVTCLMLLSLIRPVTESKRKISSATEKRAWASMRKDNCLWVAP